MSSQTHSPDGKSDRKAAVIQAVDGEKYEMTDFGRRRVRCMRKWRVCLGWAACVITIPAIFIYRRVKRLLERHPAKPA